MLCVQNCTVANIIFEIFGHHESTEEGQTSCFYDHIKKKEVNNDS